MIITCLSSTATAGTAAAEISSDDFMGRMCGVQCLYASLRLSGIEMRLRDLVDARFIGSAQGSSLADLERGAAAHGAYAKAFYGLTIDDLIFCKNAVILHTRFDPRSSRYDHYVLFLEANENGALVLDPPARLRQVTRSQLDSIWGGVGLVVAKEPIRGTSAFGAVTSRRTVAVVSVAAVVWLLVGARWYIRSSRPRQTDSQVSSRHRFTRLIGSVVTLLACSAALAGTRHALWSDGFLQPGAGATPVDQMYAGRFLPKLTVPQVLGARADEQVVVVDARRARDYAAGHVPGSVNIPVDLTLGKLATAVANVPKSARIVVYCQSEHCPYAEMVGADLTRVGYTNISLMPSGWEGWLADRTEIRTRVEVKR
jgi:rhodanese-related sulfurtransferase